MRISKEYPPNFEAICKAFPDVRTKRGVIFTYGNYIHNPSGLPIDESLAFHEAVHSKQQEDYGGAEKWWREFLANPAFRKQEELEAYRAEYRRLCELVKDRNKQTRRLIFMCNNFASTQYGSIITAEEARKLIMEAKPLSTRRIAKPL